MGPAPDPAVLRQVVAGRVMVGIAVAGVVVGVIGTLVIRQLIVDLDGGVARSLELTAVVLETVDGSFGVADDALGILAEGVADAEGAVRALGASMAEGQEALEGVGALAGGDVADALQGIEQALPEVESAAAAIDDALAALSTLPFAPPYDTDRPLSSTIGELREGLSGLPEQLREQAEQVDRTGEELAGATRGTVATADSLAELGERLTVTTDLLRRYSHSAADARELVDQHRTALAASARRAQAVAVAFGAVFVVGQFVPLYLGLMLASGGAGLRRDDTRGP